MAAPDVSVIIPAYNAERTIARCLDSLLEQAPAFEVIVVDDCSTDATADICRRYAARHGNVRLVVNEENIGQDLSRNRGMALATGTYLAFVDSDDYVDRHMYEDLLALAQSVPGGYDLVGCKLSRSFSFERRVPDVAVRLDKVRRFDREEIAHEVVPLMLGPLPGERRRELPFPWSPCTYLYRTELVRGRGIAFASERVLYSEDLFFNLDVMRAAESFAFTRTPYYVYQDNPGSTVYHYHDPLNKCRKLLEVAGDDPVLLLRARRTVLGCVIDCATQLVREEGLSWHERRATLEDLFEDPLFAEARAAYPARYLSLRCRIFYVCVRRRWPAAALVLAKLNTYRVRVRDQAALFASTCWAALRRRARAGA